MDFLPCHVHAKPNILHTVTDPFLPTTAELSLNWGLDYVMDEIVFEQEADAPAKLFDVPQDVIAMLFRHMLMAFSRALL